jgi:hypothetical protein
MSGIYYRAEATLVGDSDVYHLTPVTSFSVTGGAFPQGINLSSTNDNRLLKELEDAKAKNNLKLFKPPSKDTLEAVLAGLFSKRTSFGLNFEIFVNYKGSRTWIQIVHLFARNTIVSDQPSRQGSGGNVVLKVDFAFLGAVLKRGYRKYDKWIEDEYSYPF